MTLNFDWQVLVNVTLDCRNMVLVKVNLVFESLNDLPERVELFLCLVRIALGSLDSLLVEQQDVDSASIVHDH